MVETTTIYTRTRVGLITRMHSTQRASARKRGHSMPSYSLGELRSWVLNQPNFEILYYKWVQSNYDKWLVPSIDRIRDDEGYNFNNIQLVSFKENSDKPLSYTRKGKGIDIKNIQTGKTKSFTSIKAAADFLKSPRSSVSRLVSGHKHFKHVKGYTACKS